ncbi:TPA: hypothetical protein ACJGVM_004654 [Salmonella enterica subsp. enterica serovar Welikade]
MDVRVLFFHENIAIEVQMIKLSKYQIGILLAFVFISRSASGHWKPDTEVKIDDSQFRYSVPSYMADRPLSIDVPRAVLLDPTASVDITTGLLEKMGTFTNAIACGSFRPGDVSEQCHPISLNLSKTGVKSIRLSDIKYPGEDMAGDNIGRIVLHLMFEKSMGLAAREIVKKYALQKPSPVELQSVKIQDLEIKGVSIAHGITSTSLNTPVCFGKCIATQVANGIIEYPEKIELSGMVNKEIERELVFTVKQNTDAFLPQIKYFEVDTQANMLPFISTRLISSGWESDVVGFENKYKVRFSVKGTVPMTNQLVATAAIRLSWR